MPLKALLFDKDGTFVDFAKTWNGATAQVIDALAQGDEAVAARLAEAIHFDRAQSTLLRSSPFIAGSFGDLVPLWAQTLGAEAELGFDRRLVSLFHEASLQASVLVGAARELFASFKASGYLLGVVTNDSEASARAQCAKLGIDGFFEMIIGYDSGYGRKPEAGQVMAFLDRYQLQPHEAALIGDTFHDLDAARAAGVVAIGVATGFFTIEEMAPHADHALASIGDLPALLPLL